MERANEKVIDQTELADEDLEKVAGGWDIVDFYYKYGSGTQDGGGTGHNSVFWIRSKT
jgi:hypothetical protein